MGTLAAPRVEGRVERVRVLVPVGNRAEVGPPIAEYKEESEPRFLTPEDPWQLPPSGKCPAAIPIPPGARPSPRASLRKVGEGGPSLILGRLGAAAAPPRPNPLRKGRWLPLPPQWHVSQRVAPLPRGERKRCEVRVPPLCVPAGPLQPSFSTRPFRSSALAPEGLDLAGPGPGLPQRFPLSTSPFAKAQFTRVGIAEYLRGLVRTRKRAH